MKQLSLWHNWLPVMFIIILSGMIPSLSVSGLYAQSSSVNLYDTETAGAFNWTMYGTSTITVTGPGTLQEVFNMYGDRTFTERYYRLKKGTAFVYQEDWPNDETYSSAPGFQVTRTHTGLTAGTYTVFIQAEQRHSGTTYLHPAKSHTITLYGSPTVATPILVDRTDTSITVSAEVSNTGYGVSGGRIKIGSTWYTGTVVGGNTIYYTKTGLTANTSYSVQAEATTVEGTTTSSSTSISTLAESIPGQVIIGDGQLDAQGLPIDPYFAYSYTQQIYLQSEINMPNSRIESVSFFWNGLQTASASNTWVIYMGHTSASSFSSTTAWVPYANLTQVFSGTVDLPATPGWISIPLSTTFSYNNTDNLVIAVDENEASENTNIPYFFGTSMAAYRGIYYKSDTTNPNPSAPPTASGRFYGYPNVKLSFQTLPTVTTQAVTSITTTTATGNGNVTDIGNPDPTQHGHCWATTSNPTTANSKTTLGVKSTTGAFTSSLTSLSAGTLYYVKAYATNAAGTAYGTQVSFTTISAAPTANAASANSTTGFTANWAAATGAVSYELDVSTVNTFASFVTGYNDLNVGNVLTYAVSGLTAGSTYYYRVRAVNTGGTSVSSSTITTETIPAAPTANAATTITTSGFYSNWTAATGADSYELDVSTVNTFASFVTGYNDLNVGNVLTYAVSGLTTGTTYYYRVRAVNTGGTSASSGIITTTTYQTPTVTTQAVSSIATATATGNGNVTALGVPNPTQHGHCWATTTNPTTASSKTELGVKSATGAFTSSLTSLSAGTLYYVKAYATNSAGTVYGTEVSFTTIPAAPTANAATANSTTGFTANWTAATGADSYELDVSTVNTFVSFVTGYNDLNVGNVLTYAVSGLTAGTTYYYRVRAVNTGGTSVSSSIITAETITAAPTASAASSITTTGFNANWAAATGADSYELDVSTVNTFASFVTGYNDLNVGNVVTYAVSSLTAGTTYYYRVRAVNTGGTSAGSSTISTVTIPLAPTASAATSVTTTGFTANWAAATGATTYYFDVSTSSSFTTNLTSYNNLDVGNVIIKAVTGLSAGTTYYYRVRAYNASGTSASSSTITTVTVPSAPTANAATSVTTIGFTANWVAATGATTYYFDVSTSSSFTTNLSNYNNLNVGNVIVKAVTGLSAGTTYYYRVRAYTTGGTSINSSTITVITVPAAPTATAATSITSTGFTANWNAVTGAASYRLDVSTGSGFSSFVGSYNDLNVGNVLTYGVSGLSAGTTYYYRVRAVNSSGTSISSNTISTSSYQTPTVTTQEVSAISTTAATGNGNVTNLGNPAPTQHGHCWSTAENPTIADSKTTLGAKSSTGAFTSGLTGLTAGTEYFVRAYATNTEGTSYGNEVSFFTIPSAPTATAASSVTGTGFTANWNAATGSESYELDVSTVNTFASFVTGYNDLPVSNVTTYAVTGLTSGTTYYYRVRAVNTGGTSSSSTYQTVLTLPGTVTYTSPADTATDVNLSVDLVWTASNGSVSSYMVYFGTTNPPTALVQNDLQTSYTPDQLLYNQQYFWQVVTNNTSGVTEGPIWSFTTIDRIIVPLDPVVTDLGDVSPIVTIPDVTGEGSAIVTVTWAPVITGFTEVGLQFIITPTTITLPGRNIIITHNLGYSPVQIAYRILPATSWNMLQPTDPIVTSWNTTEISFTLPAAKADGDLEVIFPPTDGGTLAVELSTFTAIATGNNTMVRLDWTVQSETDHLGYDVLRSDSELVSTAVRVNSAIISNGTANGTLREYSFTDTEIISSNVYYYWLLSINLDGSSQFHGPVMVDMTIPGEEPPSPDIPQLTCLHDAYPNPFNPQTRISYSLKQPERVKIDIFSIKGTLVYTYEATHAMCGTYALSWNGCDRQGRSVASGMYYYRFTAGKYSQTKKMMLVK